MIRRAASVISVRCGGQTRHRRHRARLPHLIRRFAAAPRMHHVRLPSTRLTKHVPGRQLLGGTHAIVLHTQPPALSALIKTRNKQITQAHLSTHQVFIYFP